MRPFLPKDNEIHPTAARKLQVPKGPYPIQYP
jgi:hypothetical protein